MSVKIAIKGVLIKNQFGVGYLLANTCYIRLYILSRVSSPNGVTGKVIF